MRSFSAMSSPDDTDVRMTISFEKLIAPLNKGQRRTKRDIARAILDITPEGNLFHFADVLAKHEVVDNYNILRNIARHLTGSSNLLKLRALARRITQIAASVGVLHGLYDRLYVSPTYTDTMLLRDRDAFTRVAYGCTELVATFRETFGNYEFPAGMIFSGNTLHGHTSVQINDWKHVLAHCPNLTTLTVITGGCPTALLWNRTVTALTALRTAFEEAEPGLKQITTLRMVPSDPVYIGQFRWTGPTFTAPPQHVIEGWARITKLELQILPLARELGKLERLAAVKQYNAWLRILAPHLKSLRMCYVGGEEGEHPCALLSGQDMIAACQADMQMPLLEELWLGRVRNSEMYGDLLEKYAPCLPSYYVLTYAKDHDSLVTFETKSTDEQWKTVWLALTEHNEPPYARKLSNRTIERPSYDYVIPQTPIRNPERSVTAPSPGIFVPPGRPSITAVQTASTSFPPLRTITEQANTWPASTSPQHPPEQARSRITSLPNPPKQRKRGSSGLSNIFKFKSRARPKSEPNKRPEIRLVGETPTTQLPVDFQNATQVHDKLIEYVKKYGPDAVVDVVLGDEDDGEEEEGRVLRLAQQQRIGQFTYSPGTLFQAGSGAKLPMPRKLTLERDGSGSCRGGPTPEQIRQAFDMMAVSIPSLAGPSVPHNTQSPSVSRPIPQGCTTMSPEERDEYWNTYRQGTEDLAPPNPRFGSSSGSQPLAKPSWETVDRHFNGWGTPSSNRRGAWSGRWSPEERYELPASSSPVKRGSKRISQLEAVQQEDGGTMRKMITGEGNFF